MGPSRIKDHRPTRFSWGELQRREQALAIVVNALDGNPDFTRRQHGSGWRGGLSEKLHWLRNHLKIYVVGNTYLTQFEATTGNPGDAAEIVNLAADAYCRPQSTSAEALALGSDNPIMEIMDRAVVPTRPASNVHPFADSLMDGLNYVGLIMVGVGIGFFGYLVEKARRARIAA